MASRWVDAENTMHERCVLRCEIHGLHLGSTPIDPGECPELGYPRNGVALFCRDCGDVWARLTLEDSSGQVQAWQVVEAPCERHKSQWEVSGSLLAAGEGWLQYLPAAAIQREVKQHLSEKGFEQ